MKNWYAAGKQPLGAQPGRAAGTRVGGKGQVAAKIAVICG